MLRLTKLFVTVTVIWSVYWFAAGWGLQTSIGAWFEEQKRQGWQAEYSSISSDGYPSRHTTRIENPTLADPGTGAAWRADWLEVDSPAIWPGQQTLRFASTPQRLSYFDQTAIIEADDAQIQLYLAPGLSLSLEQLALTSGPWHVVKDDQATMSAKSMQLGMTQTQLPEKYQVSITADNFTPGSTLRKFLTATEALPDSFETLVLDMDVTFDTPWDRSSIEIRRPQPRQIDLKLADIQWGALRLQATGSLTVDEAGSPSGSVALKVDNWRQMLDMAEGAGLLATSALDGVERVLTLFAGLAGNPRDLDTELSFRNGQTSLGPIPLGPAPRLILR